MIAKKTIAVGALIVFILASALVGFVSQRAQLGYELYGFLTRTEEAPLIMSRDVASGKMAPAPAIQTTYESVSNQITARRTIFTAFILLEVKDFNEATQKVASIASRYGGYISDSSMNNEGVGRKTGTITVRVPENDFDAAIAELEKIGEVKNKSQTGQDVTEEYMDLETRIKNLQLEEQRFVEIMRKAEKVEDLLAIERELSRVRYEIESAQGRLNFLKNRVNLATITVNLQEPEVIIHESKLEQAWNAAIEGFLATIRGMIILTGILLPLVIVLLVVWGIWKVVKRIRR